LNFFSERQVFTMEIQFPEFKSKAKWHTPAAAAGAMAVLATAIVFVFIHWSPADGFAKALINPVNDNVLTQPRSDASEQGLQTVSDAENAVPTQDGSSVTASGLPPENNGNNPDNNAVAGGTGNDQSTQKPDSSSDVFDEHSVTPGEVTGIPPLPDTAGTGNGNNAGVSLPTAPNIVLTQETVRFKPDSSEFTDVGEAETIIAKYANNLRDYIKNSDSDAEIYVIGSAADTWGDIQRLSEQRALAVLDVLIKLGVPEKSIRAFGMSNQDPWHVNNIDENGVWLSDIAKVNRKVVLIMSGDDAAKAVKSKVAENGKTLTMFRYENGKLITEKFDKLD
jgi:outer membrane protein OmpA-like peptidoglycan-associated protein